MRLCPCASARACIFVLSRAHPCPFSPIKKKNAHRQQSFLLEMSQAWGEWVAPGGVQVCQVIGLSNEKKEKRK